MNEVKSQKFAFWITETSNLSKLNLLSGVHLNLSPKLALKSIKLTSADGQVMRSQSTLRRQL
jgi:hypothetical protein